MVPAPQIADPNDERVVDALLAEPAFPVAFHLLVNRFREIHVGHLMHKVIANEPRLLITQHIISLHAEHDPRDPDSGLTTSRLVARCLASGLMSRGRVLDTLKRLRGVGWVVDAPPGADRRITRLEPGPELIATYRDRVRMFLDALDLVRPGRPWIALLERDPAFFWAFEAERGRMAMVEDTLRRRLPAITALAMRENAYTAMIHLLHAALPPGEPPRLPHPGPVIVNMAHLADRMAMPRSQLRRILADMAEVGLITLLDGPLPVRVEPLSIGIIARWFAIRLLRFDANAARAAQQMAATA